MPIVDRKALRSGHGAVGAKKTHGPKAEETIEVTRTDSGLMLHVYS